MHLTVGMFGDNEFFSKFGKQNTSNDLLIRSQVDSGHTITYVAPNSDKIQPFVQAAAMADFVVVVVNEMTKDIGEILLMLGDMGFSSGLFVTDFLEDSIRAMSKDMSILNFKFCKKDENAVRESILSFSPDMPKGYNLVTVDEYFAVKGVGTVMLGLVKAGQIKQYDKLICYPARKEILVKSMQSQDRDIKETEPGQRIGMALKGVETDEFRRGFIFSSRDVNCSKTLNIEVTKNKYSKFEFSYGKRLMVAIGLQILSGEIKNTSGNILEIELTSDIAIYQDNCLLLTTDSFPRVIGKGKIL